MRLDIAGTFGHYAPVAWIDCILTRWVSDEPQPGLVEARLTDAAGDEWAFVDKQAIFSSDALGPMTAYPVPGQIECTVLSDRSNEGVVEIELRDGIAPEESPTVFSVRAEVVHH